MSIRQVLFLVLVCAMSPLALAAEDSERSSESEHVLGIKRVGGQYTVTDIEKLDTRLFRIKFASTAPSGRFDTLVLESDHVHVAVKEGQTLKLSAEILSENGATAEVAQMVLFLPHVSGRIPVWLLSTKAPRGELRGSRYLEMHVPLNDYTIM